MLTNDEMLAKENDIIAQSNQFLCIVLTYRFFITEAESVYSAVRTGPLNQIDTVLYLKC
jgi:hypothetical protein